MISLHFKFNCQFIVFFCIVFFAFSALTLLLGGRKGIQPVKKLWGVVRVWAPLVRLGWRSFAVLLNLFYV